MKRAIISVTGVLLLLAGCAPPRETGEFKPPQGPQPPGPAAEQYATSATPYRIRTGDQIDVKYPYRPDFNETITIRPDGKIVLPFITPVDAAGQTPEGLTAELHEAYDKLMRSEPPPAQRRYLIGVGDVIDIKSEDPQLAETETVRPDGRISLPFVNSVIAAGKSPEQLQAELRRGLKDRTANSDVTVILRTTTSHKYLANGKITTVPVSDLDTVVVMLRSYSALEYFVGGEVLRPSELPYNGPITVLQALFAAGGPTRYGEMRNVVVLRRDDAGHPTVIVRDMKADIDGSVHNDFLLKPFDIVYVPKTRIAEVQDFLDQYLYQLIPAFRNSSVGFSFLYDFNRQNP
jgi:protein involved in polysaccharide export with SLBB domain